MGTRSWGLSVLALAILAAALVPACGRAVDAPAAHQVSHRIAAVSMRGSLVSVRGSLLDVRESAGAKPVRVTFDAATTPIFAVTAGTFADLQPGSCVAAEGVRNATGALITHEILVAGSVDDTCPAAALPSPPGPAGQNLVTVRGQVVAVGGASITVQSDQADPSAVVLLPGVRVLFFQPGDRSSLLPGTCLVIQGTRSRGQTTAHQITDWPPAPTC